MTIRLLVVAALLASTGVAHATTIAQSAAPSNFVTGWTTGNGTDVLGSGVLQGKLNLVGGVAYTNGTDANVSLTDLLSGKQAGTVGNVDGQTTLFFQRGIEANYLLASGHGILAATLGLGKSVIASANGVTIQDGLAKAPVMSGGGSNTQQGDSGGGNNTQQGGSGGGIGADLGSSGGNNGGQQGNSGGENPVFSGGNGGNQGNAGGGNPPVEVTIPGNSGKPNDIGAAVPGVGGDAVEVPEPSSIALMLAGMMGAGALTRRRTR